MTGSQSKAADTDGIPSTGQVIAGKYEVERVLGVGGMGVVVAARHLQLGQRVAIKFMRGSAVEDSSAVARFLREARAVVAMRSEHVARVLDVGTLEAGAPYIVMEFLAGIDLSQMIARRGRLGVQEAVGILLQACEALAEAHVLGIVHRDLKPSNIFVAQGADGSPLVKVLDFGISKVTTLNAHPEGNASLTGSGHVMGSPGYMSPEQLRSLKATDARSDVWSLGVILYELLTGAAAFPGETLGDILARIVAEQPIPIRNVRADVPAGLASVIGRCLEKSVSARTPSVAALAAGLLPFASHGADALVERISRISGMVDRSDPTKTVAIALAGDEPEPRISVAPGIGAGKVDTAGAWLQAADPSNQRRPLSRVAKGIVAFAALTVVATVTVGVVATRAKTSSQATSGDKTTHGQVTPAAIAASVQPAGGAERDAAAAPLPSSSPDDAGAATSRMEQALDAAGIQAGRAAAPPHPGGRRPVPAPRPAASASDESAPEDMFQRRR